VAIAVAAPSKKERVGNSAGWALSFHGEDACKIVDRPVLVVGSHDYDAEIRAVLPSEIAGGSYSFTIDGLTDADYKAIARKKDAPPFARLYLFWQDLSSAQAIPLPSSPAGSIASHGAEPDDLVAELMITSVSRKAGARHYETTINARERAFAVLERPVCKVPAKELNPGVLAGIIAADLQVTSTVHDTDSLKTQVDQAEGIETRASGTATLGHLGERMEQSTKKRGRGMYLIRDGELHIGPRPIPFPKGQTKELNEGNGLVEIEALANVGADPFFDRCTKQSVPERRQFKVTLKGRPDIKPGHVVTINVPSEELDEETLPTMNVISETFGGGDGSSKSASLYVESVEHRLGRTTSFVTEVTGIDIQTDAWDTYTEGHIEPPRRTGGGSEEARVADAFDRRTRRSLAPYGAADVAEVREAHPKAGGTSPSQTLRVWKGLEPADGLPHEGPRLSIQRPTPAPLDGVPYLSPFAWGKCGLVLPRYPGTRVFLQNRLGHRHDAIDVGAIWESTHGPDSDPGDWWLILPVGVQNKSSVGDSVTPQDHSGNATNDLIDADGNRVIEVGELTIKVGRQLSAAGTRPTRATDADSITIEHTKGNARLVIKDDGTVILSGKDIKITASNEITLAANKVKVE
jgi:hypothetical protein